MRTLIHAALLAGLLLPVAGLAPSASAADLDYGYEPRPVPVLPPPPPPPCGIYRPCFRPYPRLGYFVPRPYRFGYGRPYARFGTDHYGYDRPRERFGDEGRDGFEGGRGGYGPREHAYGEGRPYADPLGHERFGGERFGNERFGGDRERFGGPRERYDRYGDDERRRNDERFDRGPDFRGAPEPYGRG